MRYRGRTTKWLISVALLGAVAFGAGAGVAAATGPKWIKWNPAKKTVELWIKAAYNGNNGSWNFNGYYEGRATIVVPTGARVLLHFVNPDGNYPHSVAITRPYGPDEMPDRLGRKQVAISRAYTRSPESGCPSCKEDARFKAKKAGRYALMCGVVGHAQAGMWLGFEVSDSVSRPKLVVASDAMGPDDQPPRQ